MKFDEMTFRILECAQPDGMGYVNDEKALKLMEDGYLKPNPKQKWCINGYKATTKGIRQYRAWLRDIRKVHGHEWLTYKELGFGRINKMYPFAYSDEYHNGPMCKKCNFSFCHHCLNEWEIPKCGIAKGTLKDDDKINKDIIRMEAEIRKVIGR